MGPEEKDFPLRAMQDDKREKRVKAKEAWGLFSLLKKGHSTNPPQASDYTDKWKSETDAIGIKAIDKFLDVNVLIDNLNKQKGNRGSHGFHYEARIAGKF